MYKFWLKVIFICSVALLTVQNVAAYKFLGIFHTSARSHFNIGSALMRGLVQQGHEVTVISPFPLKKPMKNYHDIPLTLMSPAEVSTSTQNLFDMSDMTPVHMTFLLHEMGVMMSEVALKEKSVQELLKSNQTFDAVICEVFVSDSLYGFAEHFNAPLIGVSTFGAHIWNTDMVGSPSPPSYVPNSMLHFTDRMTLKQRVANLAYNTFERVMHDFSYLPRQSALYHKYFPNVKRSLYDVRKNTALVLVNQHVSLSFPRPYVQNQIEVGGMHINRKRAPLPENIQKFLDEAKHGAIYFSMGSNLKSKELPKEKVKAILDTFRGLKQRVLWKFEDPKLEGKPDNVFISDWFPQDDVLAHPNVLAFITHGGLLSTTESIYHGKPFVGIPIFGDQYLNMARAENGGYGISLSFKEFSAEKFKSAITRIVNDQSYTTKVRDMSARYRDQPQEPLERAIFWVEHVVRHKGAKYLHCAGQDLNPIQYNNIDAMLILFGGILVVFIVLILLICLILRSILKVFGKSSKKVKKQ